MTETPTGTREAWQLVEGSSDDRVNIAVVVGPKSLAEQVAHEMNVERIQDATDSLGTTTILPVGVLAYPVRAVLPTNPKSGTRCAVCNGNGFNPDDGPEYDCDACAGTGSGIRQIIERARHDQDAARRAPELLAALHAVLWEWQYGEGGHERLRVFQGAPELTRRIDELLAVYAEQVAPIVADDGGAEGQRFLDELSADVAALIDHHEDAAEQTDLDRALYRVVWEHVYGDGTAMQNKAVNEAHPGLYDALTTLARIYAEMGHKTSPGAPNLSNLGDRLDDGDDRGLPIGASYDGVTDDDRVEIPIRLSLRASGIGTSDMQQNSINVLSTVLADDLAKLIDRDGILRAAGGRFTVGPAVTVRSAGT